ncbi:MAG: CinA family protein [Treponema sp.]|nr:CinA family protein [Treponema sp.]
MEDPASGLEAGAASLAEELVSRLGSASRILVLAESCTAGLTADLLARVPGASAVLWGSYVCYTLESKLAMLGCNRRRLIRNGLVSRETACDMAAAALEKSGADLAAAITGLAGPDGDGSGVPVGTVWVAAAGREKGLIKADEFHFESGGERVSRNKIRMQAAVAALEILLEISGDIA